MPDTSSPQPGDRTVPALFGGLYFELCVLVFCAAILSQTGQTRGPVFDVVGPDFLPTAVAWIVAALTLCQVMVHLVGWRRGRPDMGTKSATETPAGRLIAAAFGLLTVVYTLVLSHEVAPFYAATAVYITLVTVLLARRLSWREAAIGAGLGIAMGVGLQWLFTQVFIINLPV